MASITRTTPASQRVEQARSASSRLTDYRCQPPAARQCFRLEAHRLHHLLRTLNCGDSALNSPSDQSEESIECTVAVPMPSPNNLAIFA